MIEDNPGGKFKESEAFSPKKLRSPREKLGGYAILPRLVDKVRLAVSGALPPEYRPNLLRLPDPGSGLFPLDGRFLEFTGLDPEKLRMAILENPGDKKILEWVEQNAVPHSEEEKEYWSNSLETALPSDSRTAHRMRTYPDLADRHDIGQLSPFDLIDLDEGRLIL